MKLSQKANEIYIQINKENTKLGDLRKIAKEIKKDHELALELWSTGNFFPRQLAILIMDKKLITQAFVDQVDQDLQHHDIDERNQLTDWFMANQLSKDKKNIALIESWEDSPSAMQRRIFWYYQGRLRWTGRTPPPNSLQLIASIESKLADEEPEVQWAMNFTAGQIGVWEKEHRKKCIALGEKIGLYKDEVVAHNCTPNYLPEFIKIQASKIDN